MQTRTYTLRFVTPAFLGNADQAGQWRTPPIKALLRQWWRVAFWADRRAIPARDALRAMRAAEGRLFGQAGDDDGEARRSLIRIRLNRWDVGRMKSWEVDRERIVHPEVKGPVGAQLYLGYGPLVFKDGTSLKAGAAIQADEQAELRLAFPTEGDATLIDKAIALAHRFGTLGGRSRNGWGSFSLTPNGSDASAFDGDVDPRLVESWMDALELDWPHAIGRDAKGPLIWATEPLADWKTVMRRLAEIKIGMRTQFRFTTGDGAPNPEHRHWLSYPVTRHHVRDWGRSARLPNSLRFKVRAEHDGKLRGVIVHVPCLPPAQFKPDRKVIVEVWTRVHDYLDQPSRALQRIAG